MYQHMSVEQTPIPLPVGKVVCVGRNYHDHIKEMSSAIPDSPLLFMKPNSAICHLDNDIQIPTHLGECHNEIEVALLIRERIERDSPLCLAQQVWGVGIALDLTLRDIQLQAKQKGLPWEAAKSFDRSCPVSAFVEFSVCQLPLRFSLDVNGDVRQQGCTSDMIFSFEALLSATKALFTLEPGDIVLTGTPAGVGPLLPNDQLNVNLHELISVTTKVVPWP